MDRAFRYYTMSLSLIFLVAVTILTCCGCSSRNQHTKWEALPTLQMNPAELELEPFWQNENSSSTIEVQVFIEPFCRTSECLEYHETIIPYLIGESDLRATINNYPISQESRSFMLSAAGYCVLQADKDLFPEFLARSAQISDRYDNNLEIQLMIKDFLGAYDRVCVQKEINRIKQTFENKNPLELQEIPATVIDGRIVYGNLSLDDLKGLISDRLRK